jgi:hypothetical protein
MRGGTRSGAISQTSRFKNRLVKTLFCIFATYSIFSHVISDIVSNVHVFKNRQAFISGAIIYPSPKISTIASAIIKLNSNTGALVGSVQKPAFAL